LYHFICKRCSVKFCSTLGTHGLRSFDEQAAANLNVEFKEKCKGSTLCDEYRALIPGRQRQAARDALEAAAEERKVEAAAAAATLRGQQAYDRGVTDGIWMATDRQNQGRRPQAVTTVRCTQTWNYATYHPFLTTSRATERVTSFKLILKQ
jgi:hypothetical protein